MSFLALTQPRLSLCRLPFLCQYDLSYNNLSGPLALDSADWQSFVPQSLNLAMTRGLECPIRLAGFVRLESLDLHGAGFAGCDFADPDQVALPTKVLKRLDVSADAGDEVVAAAAAAAAAA